MVGYATSTAAGPSGLASIGVSGHASSAAGRNTGVLGQALSSGTSENTINGGIGVVGQGGLHGIVGEKRSLFTAGLEGTGQPEPDFGTYGVLSKGHLGVDTHGAIVSLNEHPQVGFIPMYALTGTEVGTYFRKKALADLNILQHINTQVSGSVVTGKIPVPENFRNTTESADSLSVQVTPNLSLQYWNIIRNVGLGIRPTAWVVNATLDEIEVEAAFVDQFGNIVAFPAAFGNAGLPFAIPVSIMVNGVRKNYANPEMFIPDNSQTVAASVDDSSSNGLEGRTLAGAPTPDLEAPVLFGDK